MNALASLPIWRPVASHSVRLKLAAVLIGKAKLVSYGVSALLRTWLMPWVASDHLEFRNHSEKVGLDMSILTSCSPVGLVRAWGCAQYRAV